MLRTLHVKALGILGDVSAEFPPGLVCLTGETGAGKSLIVDALKLILGGRADPDLVRQGERETVVEAVFDLAGQEALVLAFEEAGYEPEDDAVAVRRVVTADGRSRAWIQGRIATARELRDLVGRCVSVAGQHAFIGLGNAAERLRMLDAFAGLGPERTEFTGRYEALRAIRERLSTLEALVADRAARQDYLTYVRDQIEKVGPRPGEPEALAAEASRLRGAARLRELAAGVISALYEGAPSAYDCLGAAIQGLAEMARIDPATSDLARRLESARIEVREAARDAAAYAERIVEDPARLAAVDDRIDAIRRLCKRFGGSVEAVLATLESTIRELRDLDGSGTEAERLRGDEARLEQEALRAAEAISSRRVAAAAELSRKVTETLHDLAMERATMAVSVRRVPLSPTGLDCVDFDIETNPGEGFRPVSETASGGELSRVTLALFSALSATAGTPGLVLDEIDAGVSGAVAARMAEVLARAGAARQILAVTHHGPVAAKAAAHFRVEKREVGGRTVASIERLHGEARLEEIARMIGGEAITERVAAHARELLGMRDSAGHRPA